MKKMMILIGVAVCMASAYAGEINKMPVLDLLPAELSNAIEIKTTKFDEVVLDCQSLISGMNFSNNGQLVSDVKLDMFMCEEMMNYLFQSKEENLPVCIGLDSESSQLYITRETVEECI